MLFFFIFTINSIIHTQGLKKIKLTQILGRNFYVRSKSSPQKKCSDQEFCQKKIFFRTKTKKIYLVRTFPQKIISGPKFPLNKYLRTKFCHQKWILVYCSVP